MNDSTRRIILIIVVLAVFIAAFWYFTDIFIYIFAAFILSILGGPLMKVLQKIQFKGRTMPQSVAAAISLVVIFAVLGLATYIIITLVYNEIQQLGNIDTTHIVEGLQATFIQMETFLAQHHLLPQGVSLSKVLVSQVNSLIADINFSSIFGNVVDIVKGLFIFAFSVVFMTFFALKDHHIFWKMLKKMIPTTLRDNFDNILAATKSQLVRYFTGVFLEMVVVGLLDGFICYLLGVPNALLIGFMAGLLNIIPYVGPLIAAAIGMIVGVTSSLAMGMPLSVISVIIIKVLGTFLAVKLTDDFILQPIIYGKSVSAHPLEIFIVILIAGKVGGIWGMMFAVPAYTLVRIIVKEFFGHYFIEMEEQV